MKHYEVIFLVSPDKSEQVPAMIEGYASLVEKSKGIVHRKEDLGRRALAYTLKGKGSGPNNEYRKAHYVLMNIECEVSVMDELKNKFRFNDAILRNLVLQMKKAVTEPSILAKEKEGSNQVSDFAERRPRSAPRTTDTNDSAVDG